MRQCADFSLRAACGSTLLSDPTFVSLMSDLADLPAIPL